MPGSLKDMHSGTFFNMPYWPSNNVANGVHLVKLIAGRLATRRCLCGIQNLDSINS